jgi:hypothetical protein
MKLAIELNFADGAGPKTSLYASLCAEQRVDAGKSAEIPRCSRLDLLDLYWPLDLKLWSSVVNCGQVLLLDITH